MKNLYVIGNGFDLHHGIPCCFSDFREWLKANDETTFERMESLYDLWQDEEDSNKWWSDFEYSLGRANGLLHIINNESYNVWEGVKEVENSFINYFEGERWRVQNEIEVLYEDLKIAFSNWVLSLPWGNTYKKIVIDKQALFLSFNYTNTLELLYGIPKERVAHLHGSIDEPGSICFGHGEEIKEIREQLELDFGVQDNEEEQYDFIKDSFKDSVSEAIMYLKKDVKGIINQFSAFFESLCYDALHIYGFSFSTIDIPYIDAILKHSDYTNLSIEVSWYNEEDKSRIWNFIKDRPHINHDNVVLIKLEDIRIIKALLLF